MASFFLKDFFNCYLGVTNYPIGVVQNSQGDVLIADNHNNFNLTIFNQGKIASLRYIHSESIPSQMIFPH